MAINLTYSYGNFSGVDLTLEPAVDFNNSEIIRSTFYQHDNPRSDVFPSDITGVTFIDCNLDNCNIPVGATLTRCTNLQIKPIAGEDCIVDAVDDKLDSLDHYLSIAFWRDI